MPCEIEYASMVQNEMMNQMITRLCYLEDSLAETKEEMSEVVANWFSQNDIEPNALLTNIQKNVLDETLYILKHQEEMLKIDIDICVDEIRRHVSMEKQRFIESPYSTTLTI